MAEWRKFSKWLPYAKQSNHVVHAQTKCPCASLALNNPSKRVVYFNKIVPSQKAQIWQGFFSKVFNCSDKTVNIGSNSPLYGANSSQMPGYTRFWNWLIHNKESYLTHAVWAMIVVFWFQTERNIIFLLGIWAILLKDGPRSPAKTSQTKPFSTWETKCFWHLHPRLCAKQQSPQPPHSLRHLVLSSPLCFLPCCKFPSLSQALLQSTLVLAALGQEKLLFTLKVTFWYGRALSLILLFILPLQDI